MPDENLPEYVTRTDLIHARISLVGDDYADVIALPLGELAELQKVELAGADLAAVTAALDRTLTRAITAWSLEGISESYGVTVPKVPSEITAENRRVLWEKFPLSVLMQLVKGIVAHSGN